MARKRQRDRSKSKVAVNTSSSTETSSDAKAKLDQSIDSGNESPEVNLTKEWEREDVPHHCAESIKAWVCIKECLVKTKYRSRSRTFDTI